MPVRTTCSFRRSWPASAASSGSAPLGGGFSLTGRSRLVRPCVAADGPLGLGRGPRAQALGAYGGRIQCWRSEPRGAQHGGPARRVVRLAEREAGGQRQTAPPALVQPGTV